MLNIQRRVERLQTLQRLAHEVHEEMTDLITGADLDQAEKYISHALKWLRSREQEGEVNGGGEHGSV